MAELYRDDAIVLDGLRDRATREPDRLALIYGPTGQTWSCGGLFDTVCRAAAGLCGLGVQPGDRVAVFTQGPLTPTVLMFATWQCGAIYAPVNFNLRGQLLRYQLSDTDPAVIAVDAPLVAALDEVLADTPDATTPIVIVDAEVSFPGRRVVGWDELLAHDPAEGARIERTPHDIANIIYTSGTTGHPKGVLQPYRWMTQYTFVSRRMITPDDIVYNDLPMYHVGGAIFNVARAIWAGGAVSLWDKFSPTEFGPRIIGTGATAAVLLDVMIPWLMNAAATDTDRANPLDKVHMQPLPLYHHDVARRFGIDWVSCGFGQTETGAPCVGLIDEAGDAPGTPDDLRRGLDRSQILALMRDLGVPVLQGDRPLAKGFMGVPAPFCALGVVDDLDEPCAPGEPGNLVVRPHAPSVLFREYFRRPDASVEATRNQWFHTGDVARLDTDGFYYFVDRGGDRIRSRGENVSSLQVEDLLCQHPQVSMAAVFPIPAADGLEHDIVAFVVPTDDTLDADTLQPWIAEHLPRYMRPRHVRLIDELPRTPTNKVEKYKLRTAIVTELDR